MIKVFYILIVIIGGGFLLRRSARADRKQKFERKPSTPWTALNDDVDPTL